MLHMAEYEKQYRITKTTKKYPNSVQYYTEDHYQSCHAND